MKPPSLAILCCLILALAGCSGQSGAGTTATGTNLQGEIDRLAKENEQLKQLQQLKQENDALMNPSSSSAGTAKKTNVTTKKITPPILPASLSVVSSSESPRPQCTADAWDCTAGACISGSGIPPVCTLIDTNCIDPKKVKPILSPPICFPTTSSSVPKESSSIPVSLPIDESVTLGILNFIGPTELNMKNIDSNIQYYSDGSHAEFVRVFREIYSGISARVEFLRDYANISKTRGLTSEEMQKVYKWEAEINNLIDKGNNMLK